MSAKKGKIVMARKKKTVIEKQSDICEEKLDVVHIFPYAGTFTDNYIQVCSDGRTAHSIQGLQCHKGCAGESMGRA